MENLGVMLVLAGAFCALALPVAVVVIASLWGVNRRRSRAVIDWRTKHNALERRIADMDAIHGARRFRSSAGHVVEIDPARCVVTIDGLSYDLSLLANGLATPSGALVKTVKEHGRPITTAYCGPLVQLVLAGLEDEAVEVIGKTIATLHDYDEFADLCERLARIMDHCVGWSIRGEAAAGPTTTQYAPAPGMSASGGGGGGDSRGTARVGKPGKPPARSGGAGGTIVRPAHGGYPDVDHHPV